MTTALDRLLDAINDDGPIPRESQLDLVIEINARLVKVRERECWRCGHQTDTDGFCDSCAEVTPIDRGVGAVLSEPRANAQEGKA